MSPPQAKAADTTTDLEGQAKGWRPEPGDEVEGTLVDIDVATSTQRAADGGYPEYPLLKIRKDDGEEVFVHCFHMTLQRPILDRRPEIGHRIRIKFHGKKPLTSDPTRSVALYSLELPDTPKTAASAYDRLERQARRRPPRGGAATGDDPDVPIDSDGLDEADAFLS